MKKLFLSAAIALSIFAVKTASAQVSLNINIGSQPVWGPVGYDYVNYYYLPDIDAYYDVPARQYVVYENNVWVHRAALPSRYSSYNPYRSYKVVVNERTPWRQHTVIRNKYVSYKGRPSQVIIRDSRDVKYTKYHGPKANVTRVKVHSNNGNKKSFTKVKVKGNGKHHGNGKGRGRD
ncbi:hypothetical protein DJ568_12790 [Mucilaginibacter hurinus]|uniref:Uncharacterized protein n=1 Tax=Mucilaginibacter hurinus TaxID=2201324 RepID=A0A367GMB1_9SPHI|nr:hypothetical protein [Mucilaginibacter hurinus]RCH54175.1 hypothetical protein DJ568_12790 [Mucilaginibacter hurinus]